MNKFLIGGSAALVGLMGAGAAMAADLPSRTGPVSAPMIYSAPPAFSWTGFYVGVNAGYSFNDNKANTIGTPTFVALGAAVPGSLSVGKDGFIGGAQIGYNTQFNGAIIGVETDIQYVDGKRGSVFTSLAGVSTAASSGLEYLGTLRARIGFAPADRMMIYATGGLAYGNPNNRASVATAGGGLWGGGNDETRFGYALGGGVEYALTNNLTAKVEYLYYDLGKRTVTAQPLNGAAALTGLAYQARFENNGHIVRGGVNYKF
jgi:outer membrane immunogenic protein